MKMKNIYEYLVPWVLVFSILALFAFLGLGFRRIKDKLLIKNGRVTEGKIVVSFDDEIRYLYFDEIRNDCVTGSRHTHYSRQTMPLVGERYKVFYDSKMSVLSVDDYLVKFRDSVLMINGDFYKIDSDTIQIDSFLPEICPD